MPELPEVETVRRTLAAAIGDVVTAVWTSGKPLRLGTRVPKQRLRGLIGQPLTGTGRHGKAFWLALHDTALLVHLGMSGQFLLLDQAVPRAPHTHVMLSLASGRQLRFVDPRRFGLVDVTPVGTIRKHAVLCTMGLDPIADRWDPEHFAVALYGKRTPIKVAILDQRVVAGVGNIYASEALWRARIAPTRQAGSLRSAEVVALHASILAVLRESIEHGGTTLRDYRAADGSPGYHMVHLGVYDRAGLPCSRCRTPIRASQLGGRATYWCPGCLKKA